MSFLIEALVESSSGESPGAGGVAPSSPGAASLPFAAFRPFTTAGVIALTAGLPPGAGLAAVFAAAAAAAGFDCAAAFGGGALATTLGFACAGAAAFFAGAAGAFVF